MYTIAVNKLSDLSGRITIHNCVGFPRKYGCYKNAYIQSDTEPYVAFRISIFEVFDIYTFSESENRDLSSYATYTLRCILE